MKQRIDSDLSATIEKLCSRLIVDTRFCNDQAVCIAGGADIADFRVLHICNATLVQPIIADIKWNGFDNFTGNSLSHLVTPNDNYCSKITR
jgi:hypothetical protein